MKTFAEYEGVAVKVPSLPEDEAADAILEAIDSDHEITAALDDIAEAKKTIKARLTKIVPDNWRAIVEIREIGPQ